MRILVLCYEYPPVGGGGGRAARDIAVQLAGRGHEVEVVTAGMSHLPREEVDQGVRVLRPQTFRKREEACSVPEMGAYLALALPVAAGRCKRWKPHVIHAHFAMPTGALAWVLSRFTKIPYLLTAQLGDVPGGVPAQTDRLFRVLGPFPKWIWQGAGATTGVSTFVCELAHRAYGVDAARIPNGVDLSDAPPPPDTVGDPIRLVFAGRFNPQKNLPFLMRCLAECKRHPWRLEMVGDGDEAREVRRLITEGGLSDRVTLHGWLDEQGVDAVFARSDALVLPSLSEGLPLVCVQALKHGLAIAASRIPGLKDVVLPGRNGQWASPTSIVEFREMLDGFLSDRGRILEMRRTSRQLAEEFEIGRVADQYEQLLRAVALPPVQ